MQRRKGIGEVAKIQEWLMALLYLGWPNSSEAEATQGGGGEGGGGRGLIEGVAERVDGRMMSSQRATSCDL